jgi:hypothetical protein
MLAALRRGDRPEALEAALDAYFGPAIRPKPPGVPSPLATLFTRFEPGLVRQNHLAIPRPDSRTFYVENQSCNDWALGNASDDPPVVRDKSVVENESLSGFAIQVVLFEASMGALDWRVGGPMNAQGRASLLSGVEEVPLRPWTWPNNARFYVAPGIVAHADRLADDEVWVFASATTKERLVEFARLNVIDVSGVDGPGDWA